MHIKYSNDGGKTFTENNGEEVGDYIGTCTNFNPDDPTDVSSYKWAKIKGNDGLNGKDGEKGDLSDFPDDLPETPVLKVVRTGFKSISLSWTFTNKPHYSYELYASQTKDFTPNSFDLIFKGMASSYLHEVECSQTWYYKVRAVNTYNSATSFSNQVSATTTKISDGSTYFEDAAIGSALIGSLNADVINAGKVKGTYIDAKNLRVTDGNGNTTLSVSDSGNITLNPENFYLNTDELFISSSLSMIKTVKSTDTTQYVEFTDGYITLHKGNDRMDLFGTDIYIYNNSSKRETTISDNQICNRQYGDLVSPTKPYLNYLYSESTNDAKFTVGNSDVDFNNIGEFLVNGNNLGVQSASSIYDNGGLFYVNDLQILYGSIATIATGTKAQIDVSFRENFKYPPCVMATINSTAANITVGVTSVSVSGFKITVNRSSTTNTTVFWYAIGQKV